VFTAVTFVVCGPFLRLESVQRTIAGIDVDAGDSHVAFAVGVVEDRAGAALLDGGITAG
jgi:hypothetical protein